MFLVVSHAEELNYLFVINGINQTASEDSADMKTWRRMVRLWTNFIKYGFVEQSNFNYDYEPILVLYLYPRVYNFVLSASSSFLM